MWSSKFIFGFVLIPSFAIATVALAAPAVQKSSASRGTTPVVKIAANSITRFEAGAGLLQWNETMSLTQGSATTKGFANYTGPALIFNATRIYRSWLVTGMLAASLGQAAAGGFGPTIIFSDSKNRSWYAVVVNPSFSYRATNAFSVGMGAMARARFMDWAPGDTSIRVETRPPLAFGLSLNLHWSLMRRLALMQTIAYTGVASESQWTTSAQYVF